MYSQESAPRSIGGVLDGAIGLYRQCLPRSWPLAFVPELALSLLGSASESRMRAAAAAGLPAVFAVLRSPAFLLSSAAGMLLFLIFNFALIAHINGIATGRPASLRDSCVVGLRLLPRALAATLLIALIIALGCVLLVAPGIYWAGTLMLTFTALVVERAGVFESMNISRRLIKGDWWRTMTIYSVVIVIAAVAYLFMGLVIGLCASLFGLGNPLAVGVQRLIALIVSTLMMMWYPPALLAIYYDLKSRREGADLAQRVNALPAG
ncbi:MAG TPA: hypothetical protein VMV25_12505 [Steroidobacteraceae bacterium]|nr:hypothetical protein [Steroidobacteraceae bacterium]